MPNANPEDRCLFVTRTRPKQLVDRRQSCAIRQQSAKRRHEDTRDLILTPYRSTKLKRRGCERACPELKHVMTTRPTPLQSSQQMCRASAGVARPLEWASLRARGCC
eukprot:1895906-Prymnesium_polylepis.1